MNPLEKDYTKYAKIAVQDKYVTNVIKFNCGITSLYLSSSWKTYCRLWKGNQDFKLIKNEPDLNRHWFLHGASNYNGEEVHCIKLFVLLSSILGQQQLLLMNSIKI